MSHSPGEPPQTGFVPGQQWPQPPQQSMHLPSPPSQRAYWHSFRRSQPRQQSPAGQWVWQPSQPLPLQSQQLFYKPPVLQFGRPMRMSVKIAAIALIVIALVLVLYGGGPFFVLACLLLVAGIGLIGFI
jgi:hypothetical protein